MSAILLGHFEVESPEWHAARANGLGGSEIAAVLGLSKWASRYSLWHEKKGRIPERVQNKAMTVGKYVEPSILAWWADQHPELYPAQGGTYQSAERPWQVANPDTIALDTESKPAGVVECKFAIYDYEWGVEGTDQIPPYYLAQCRWYLDVFGLDVCYVAVLFGGSGRFAEYVVKQDQADVQLMRAEGQAFIDSLELNVRPDIDSHGATYEVLRETAVGVGAGDLEVSGEVAGQYLDAKADLDTAKTAMQFATNRVLGLLNDTDRKRATHDGRAIAYKTKRGEGTPYLQASPNPKEAA
jgi:putative phage-type endonuclease